MTWQSLAQAWKLAERRLRDGIYELAERRLRDGSYELRCAAED
jgi:hypothetical protein